MYLTNMEERLMHKCCSFFIIINKYNYSYAYEKLNMGNKDKFYVVFVRRKLGVYTS